MREGQLVPSTAEQIIQADDNGELWTTSLIVAEKFGKVHKNVLRNIQNLECPDEFAQLNFEPGSYMDAQNQERPMTRISESGFMLLVMGFTGQAAMEWKVKFINAFQIMRHELMRQSRQETKAARKQATAAWQQARLEGKVARVALTDGIQELVAYAKAQGSKSAERYFINITTMEYQALFFLEQTLPDNFRDTLTMFQNANLATAERIAQKAIREGIEKQMPYKEIYQLAKQRVVAFVDLIGKTRPGEDRTLMIAA